jgi:hypothetical protein
LELGQKPYFKGFLARRIDGHGMFSSGKSRFRMRNDYKKKKFKVKEEKGIFNQTIGLSHRG